MTAGKALSDKDMNGRKVINNGTPSNPGDAATKGYTDTEVTGAKSRANHTGNQTASTISDFDSQVRTSRLDQMAAPTAPVAFNGQKATGQADPTSPQDSATKAYVDAQLAGVVTGSPPKGTVRVAATSNVNLASPGTTIDGVTMVNGDIFLATAQTTGSQNGPYVFNGSATAATRAPNWDTQAEASLGSFWVVREGSKADNFALLTNDTFTLATTTATFYFLNPIGGNSVGRYAADCPTVAAGATWTVAHNLGSTDVVAQVKRVASPFDFVDVFVSTSDANTVLVQPDVGMAAGEYRVIVKY